MSNAIGPSSPDDSARRAAEEARRRAEEARRQEEARRAAEAARAAQAAEQAEASAMAKATRVGARPADGYETRVGPSPFTSRPPLAPPPAATGLTFSAAQLMDGASSLATEQIGDGRANCLEQAYAAAGSADSVVLSRDRLDPVGHAVVLHPDGTVSDPNVPQTVFDDLSDWRQATGQRYEPFRSVPQPELAQVFSLPPGAERDARIASLGLADVAQARVADPPPPPRPGSLISPEDQQALARLEHFMRNDGATPQEIDTALESTRLRQIERDLATLASTDATAMLTQGQALEATSQEVLDNYIRNVDSIYSGLAPLDRAQAGYLAWGQDVQAKATTYEALLVQTREAELTLEQAVIQREQALAAGASPAAIAEHDARIAASRVLLEGDPAAAAQIEELERELDLMGKTAELYDPNRPAGWQAEQAERMADVRAEIAALEARLPENGLLPRLDTAQGRYDFAAEQLEAAQSELVLTVSEYQSALETTVPVAQATIAEFREVAELDTRAPEFDQALADLSAILPTATPQELQAALDRIEAMPNGDFMMGRLMQTDILGVDPRIRLLSGREIGVPSGLERFGMELVLNTAMLGLPSFIENQRILDTPGASGGLVLEAQFGRALDYVGFALTVAGPLIEGVQTVLRGGRTVVEFTPEMTTALRAAGYADDAIEELALRLGAAATDSRALSELLLTSSPDEAAELVDLMSRSMTLERRAEVVIEGYHAPPGFSNTANQVVFRPQEVVDFLVHSDPAAVKAFWGLVDEGRSLDEARTIMTLVRNGKPLDDITAALAGGQSLDDVVADTLFQFVDAQGAHDLAGLPLEYVGGGTLEDFSRLAEERGWEIVFRDTNPQLAETMLDHVPKDNHGILTVGDRTVRVGSFSQETIIDGVPTEVRFKSDPATGRIQLQQLSGEAWVGQGQFVITNPATGDYALASADVVADSARLAAEHPGYLPMGPDIDILYISVQGPGGEFRVMEAYSHEAEEVRALLNEIAQVPPEMMTDDIQGVFRHGANLPYFNTNRNWTPSLVFTPEGRMVWLRNEDAVELWMKTRGLSPEPYAQYNQLVSELIRMPVPSSAATYLGGTFVGNVPEIVSVLPTGGGSPSGTPTGTPTYGGTQAPAATPQPTATVPPPPTPQPVATPEPTATPVPVATPTPGP